jgi:uncharacterized protein YkwD
LAQTPPTPVPPLPVPAALRRQLTEAVPLHNASRAKHCVPPLTWSDALARTAQAWADKCVFEHDLKTEEGENLAIGEDMTMREAHEAWYDEELPLYDFKKGEWSEETGHMTQIVWRETRQVGCAVAICPGQGNYWVCRYAPAGNYEGEFIENVPEVCKPPARNASGQQPAVR